MLMQGDPFENRRWKSHRKRFLQKCSWHHLGFLGTLGTPARGPGTGCERRRPAVNTLQRTVLQLALRGDTTCKHEQAPLAACTNTVDNCIILGPHVSK